MSKGHKRVSLVQRGRSLSSEIIPTLWVGFIRTEVYGPEKGNELYGRFSSKLLLPIMTQLHRMKNQLATAPNKEIFTLQKKVSGRQPET